jgi:flavin reductase (DIM6/NTAB) family NADH-FMN oxidoreductase RutF
MVAKAAGYPPSLTSYLYRWPTEGLTESRGWFASTTPGFMERLMPEPEEVLASDSRWPAMFPSAVCVVATGRGETCAIEKVVGPCIVNRFPLVMSLSFCRRALSERHYARRSFMELLEANGTAAVQFLAPGPNLSHILSCIEKIPDERTTERIAATGLATRPALCNASPVFQHSYLVYEGRLVKPNKDFDGEGIFDSPYTDIGSHRMYFLEVEAIQLREDLASGSGQLLWQSLPQWQPRNEERGLRAVNWSLRPAGKYIKGFTPYYAFPSTNTVAFIADGHAHGMAYKRLPPLVDEQVEVDNDAARWPCFFPSSVGMITTRGVDGQPNVMPCGSTVVVSRSPLSIGIAVGYARINERYSPRASLNNLRHTRRFGCAVAYASLDLAEAIRYLGTSSIADDPSKVESSGLMVMSDVDQPLIPGLPVNFDCRVVHEQRLGTHVLFVGEVERILCRTDVDLDNPLTWSPFAAVPEFERSRQDCKAIG